MDGFETVLPMPFVLVFHRMGLAGVAPAWLLLTSMTVSGLMQVTRVQVRLAGGDLRRRLNLRLALHLVPATAALYLTGWGPVLVIGYVIACLQHIRWTGSAAWRPAIWWSAAGIAVGQAATAAGWIFTYLTPVQVQMAGVGEAFVVVLVVRRFGTETACREEAQEELHRSEQRFRALVQYSSDMTVVLGPDAVVEYVSPAVEELLGLQPEELLGRRISDLIAPEDTADADRLTVDVERSPGMVLRSELRFRHRDGSMRWHHVTMRNLRDAPGVGAVVANHRDVTEQRLARDRLAYEATHDLLTGLDNRGAFLGHLRAALERDADPGRAVAVLFIDLDGFKQVNDTFGHEAGDRLLTSVATILRRLLLGSDTIGRLGGDEFAVVLPRIGTAENAVAVAARILECLAEPIVVAGRTLPIGASIGIALATGEPTSEPSDEAADLLRRADLAMYDAKRGRGSRSALYHPGLEPTSRVTTEEIRVAVATGQLRLAYQPIVQLSTGRLVAAEALVRWRHPTRGLLLPSDFVPVAEENGLIGLVGEWVMRSACHQLAAWRSRFAEADQLRLGVNVAADQLEDGRMAPAIVALLDGLRIPPDRLVLEITESVLADSPAARIGLETLHEAGVRIAIDDFGTGYSSLQYLTRLPADVVKLDRAFVAELNGTAEGAAIAVAVARLAHTLHLDITAEGVETPEQAAELCGIGYGTAQGYLFAEPVSAERFALMIADPSPLGPAPATTAGAAGTPTRPSPVGA